MREVNDELYESRNEPRSLARLRSRHILPSYPSLRVFRDKEVIGSLIRELEEYGSEYVVVSWISPPFGKVVGYGLYKKREAEELSERSVRENWVFPQVGSIYDKRTLEGKLKESDNFSIDALDFYRG